MELSILSSGGLQQSCNKDFTDLLAHSIPPLLSCWCHGGERRDRAWAAAASENVQKQFWLFFNVSWFYFKMLVWIILPNEHFFVFSVMFFFNIWIWNFIQHLLHHILPDFFLLASCPIYLMLNDTFYFEDRIAMCVFQLRSYETILYVLRHWLTL